MKRVMLRRVLSTRLVNNFLSKFRAGDFNITFCCLVKCGDVAVNLHEQQCASQVEGKVRPSAPSHHPITLIKLNLIHQRYGPSRRQLCNYISIFENVSVICYDRVHETFIPMNSVSSRGCTGSGRLQQRVMDLRDMIPQW